MLIRNKGDLERAIRKKLDDVLNDIAKDVQEEIQKALDSYYEEYDPSYYPRTNQLRDCCKIQKTGSGKYCVYLDIDSLNYRTEGADAYKTVVAANSGLHGGYDYEKRKIVPWTEISENVGKEAGPGTQIWEGPMFTLLSEGEIINLFKKAAERHGLKLKTK